MTTDLVQRGCLLFFRFLRHDGPLTWRRPDCATAVEGTINGQACVRLDEKGSRAGSSRFRLNNGPPGLIVLLRRTQKGGDCRSRRKLNKIAAAPMPTRRPGRTSCSGVKLAASLRSRCNPWLEGVRTGARSRLKSRFTGEDRTGDSIERTRLSPALAFHVSSRYIREHPLI
jgi:hypothetical protein